MAYDPAFTPSSDTVVSRAEQATRDKGAVEILQQELQKARQAVASATNADDRSRAASDVAAVTRELGRYGVTVPAGNPTPAAVAAPQPAIPAPARTAIQPPAGAANQPVQNPATASSNAGGTFNHAMDWLALHAEPLLQSAPGVFLTGVGRGATAGLIKYPAAAITYATTDKNWQQSVDQAQQTYSNMEQAHPIANLAGQVTGAVVGPGKAVSTLGKVAQAGATGTKLATVAAPAARIAANTALGATNAYSNDQNVGTGATIGALAGTIGEGLGAAWTAGKKWLQQGGKDAVNDLVNTRATALQAIRDGVLSTLQRAGMNTSGLSPADVDGLAAKMKFPSVDEVLGGKPVAASPGWKAALSPTDTTALQQGGSTAATANAGAAASNIGTAPGANPSAHATVLESIMADHLSPVDKLAALRATTRFGAPNDPNGMLQQTAGTLEKFAQSNPGNFLGSHQLAADAAEQAMRDAAIKTAKTAAYSTMGGMATQSPWGWLAGAGLNMLQGGNPVGSILDFAKLAAVSGQPVSTLIKQGAEQLPAGTQWIGKAIGSGAGMGGAALDAVSGPGATTGLSTGIINSMVPPQKGPTKAAAAQLQPKYDPAFTPDNTPEPAAQGASSPQYDKAFSPD